MKAVAATKSIGAMAYDAIVAFVHDRVPGPAVQWVERVYRRAKIGRHELAGLRHGRVIVHDIAPRSSLIVVRDAGSRAEDVRKAIGAAIEAVDHLAGGGWRVVRDVAFVRPLSYGGRPDCDQIDRMILAEAHARRHAWNDVTLHIMSCDETEET